MQFINNMYCSLHEKKHSLFYLEENKKQFFSSCFEKIAKETELLKSDKFIQHGDTSCLWHSIAVAYYSYCFFNTFKLKCDEKSLLYGALLHDYFLYDWHENDKSHNLHGFRHPKTALKNAQQHYELNAIEIDIIKNHMFPLTLTPPHHKESIMVSIFDKICSTYETFNRNTYTKLKSALR